MGKSGIATLIERTCQHANALVAQIGTLPGAEILWEPTINQGLIRFPSPNANATESDHDQHTDAVVAAIQRRGEAFFGATT